MRISSMLSIAWLGLAACATAPAPAPVRAPAPTPPSRYSEADSATVLKIVVDDILSGDGGRLAASLGLPRARAAYENEQRVFVRVGAWPMSAWEAPIVARLRGWHWFRGGRAVDSMRALAGLEDRPGTKFPKPIPLELGLRIDFVADTAVVSENWFANTCETRPRSMAVLTIKSHRFTRTPSGWKASGNPRWILADLRCSGRRQTRSSTGADGRTPRDSSSDAN